jgi:hypothetical protein
VKTSRQITGTRNRIANTTNIRTTAVVHSIRTSCPTSTKWAPQGIE